MPRIISKKRKIKVEEVEKLCLECGRLVICPKNHKKHDWDDETGEETADVCDGELVLEEEVLTC